jgi:colanic acid/amylovoran biosynthesis glycosyltransferase
MVIMSDKIRVVHYRADWLPVTENWLFNQINYLPVDVESSVVCERRQNWEMFPLPRIHCISDSPYALQLWDKGLRWLSLRNHLGYLTRVMKLSGADILHSHFGHYGWANLRAVSGNVKHVVTFYGLDVNQLPVTDERWIGRYRELFERVDRILCEGPHMASCIVRMGCPEEKISVHHLGVEVDDIPFQPRQLLPGEPLRVLIAASFREKKGIPAALEALGRVQSEIPLEITIIGDANNESKSRSEKRKILAVIHEYDLLKKVRMLGYQPHSIFLDEALKHHIFLAPSITASDGDSEGGAPVSIIEMMASGMPVVSTRHCDIPEVTRNGEFALLAAELDVSGLVEHIRWLARHPEDWGVMLVKARQNVEAEFNAKIQGEKLGSFYRNMVC